MNRDKKINIALFTILLTAFSGFIAIEVTSSNNDESLDFIVKKISNLFPGNTAPEKDIVSVQDIKPVQFDEENELEAFTERPLALITRLIPNLAIKNVERNKRADKGSELFSGDTLRTDENGYALVVFMDKSTAKVRPQSQLIVRGEIDRNQNSRSRISLNSGEIFLEVEKRPNNELEVITSTTVASVKGTRFGATHTGYFWVEEGEVEITLIESGESVTITDGMFSRIDDDETALVTGELSDGEIAELAEDYRILDSELIEKRLLLRFRDANGQLREEEVIYYEQNNNE